MFNAISWTDFLTTVAVLIAGYYAITILLLYANEIKSLFRRKSLIETPEDIHSTAPLDRTILGGVSKESTLQDRSSFASADEFSFSESNHEVPEMLTPVAKQPLSNHALIIGSVSDLLQEIKTLIQMVTEYKSGKAESETLFRTLLQRYPQLKTTEYRTAITQFIWETAQTQFPFALEQAEVEQWWE